MNREALHESLSAVMDNEASGLEVRRVLASTRQDSSIRATWIRYQIARTAMHRQLPPVDLGQDMVAAVSAAIAAEEREPVRSSWLGGLGRVAIAASVMLAVLAGVRLYHLDGLAGSPLLATHARQEHAADPVATVALPPVQAQLPAVTVSYPSSGGQASIQRVGGVATGDASQAIETGSHSTSH